MRSENIQEALRLYELTEKAIPFAGQITKRVTREVVQRVTLDATKPVNGKPSVKSTEYEMRETINNKMEGAAPLFIYGSRTKEWETYTTDGVIHFFQPAHTIEIPERKVDGVTYPAYSYNVPWKGITVTPTGDNVAEIRNHNYPFDGSAAPNITLRREERTITKSGPGPWMRSNKRPVFTHQELATQAGWTLEEAISNTTSYEVIETGNPDVIYAYGVDLKVDGNVFDVIKSVNGVDVKQEPATGMRMPSGVPYPGFVTKMALLNKLGQAAPVWMGDFDRLPGQAYEPLTILPANEFTYDDDENLLTYDQDEPAFLKVWIESKQGGASGKSSTDFADLYNLHTGERIPQGKQPDLSMWL